MTSKMPKTEAMLVALQAISVELHHVLKDGLQPLQDAAQLGQALFTKPELIEKIKAGFGDFDGMKAEIKAAKASELLSVGGAALSLIESGFEETKG